MIHVDDALERILNSVSSTEKISIELSKARGFVLAEDLASPIHMPPFDQSAMDGYAIHETNSDSYQIIDEIQAGDDASSVELKPGEAIRIFTGAMVPSSATTVVKQEITSRQGDQLSFTEPFPSGANIRSAGEQIRKGDLALAAGTLLNPASIGFLAMLGIEKVQVYRKPKIALLITGNELIPAGNTLKPGQIYESNSATLLAALDELNIPATVARVEDSYEKTSQKIQSLLQACDVLISTGGISVGDYDFVGKALLENGVSEIFYKVRHKPGKPLFYGTSDSCKVFALPGNPASALAVLYLYVFPALQKMMGDQNPGLEKRTARLNQAYSKTGSMTHFLKGFADQEGVSILEGQSSAMLNSFALSNCLIRMDEGKENWIAGDLVTIFMLL